MKLHNSRRFLEHRRELRKNATPEEVIFWNALRSNKLGVKFHRQHSIGDYIVDFYCYSHRLIIEIDGRVHDGACQSEYDKRRDEYLNQLQYQILRFKNEEILCNLSNVLERIHRTLSLLKERVET